jgi:hypothetical protein
MNDDTHKHRSRGKRGSAGRKRKPSQKRMMIQRAGKKAREEKRLQITQPTIQLPNPPTALVADFKEDENPAVSFSHRVNALFTEAALKRARGYARATLKRCVELQAQFFDKPQFHHFIWATAQKFESRMEAQIFVSQLHRLERGENIVCLAPRSIASHTIPLEALTTYWIKMNLPVQFCCSVDTTAGLISVRVSPAPNIALPSMLPRRLDQCYQKLTSYDPGDVITESIEVRLCTLRRELTEIAQKQDRSGIRLEKMRSELLERIRVAEETHQAFVSASDDRVRVIDTEIELLQPQTKNAKQAAIKTERMNEKNAKFAVIFDKLDLSDLDRTLAVRKTYYWKDVNLEDMEQLSEHEFSNRFYRFQQVRTLLQRNGTPYFNDDE